MGFSYQLNALTEDELAKAAKEEFGETSNLMETSLKDLRAWLAKSPHLHSIQQDDVVLKTFLRGCKFSMERTKEKLDNFHAVKGECPEWFHNWDPNMPLAQEILGWGAYLPLPGFDKKGRMVLMCQMEKINPAKINFNHLMWACQMIISTAVKKCTDQLDIKGMVIITDMKGASANHLTLFNISIMKKLITMMETAWPMKPKAEHILNMPGFFESMHSIIQGMQKEKMRQRTKVHKSGELSALHEDIGTEILPAEYGGSNGTIADLTTYWKEEVMKERTWLMSLGEFKTDESRRPGKPRTHADLFGIEGSFRKLDID